MYIDCSSVGDSNCFVSAGNHRDLWNGFCKTLVYHAVLNREWLFAIDIKCYMFS